MQQMQYFTSEVTSTAFRLFQTHLGNSQQRQRTQEIRENHFDVKRKMRKLVVVTKHLRQNAFQHHFLSFVKFEVLPAGSAFCKHSHTAGVKGLFLNKSPLLTLSAAINKMNG